MNGRGGTSQTTGPHDVPSFCNGLPLDVNKLWENAEQGATMRPHDIPAPVRVVTVATVLVAALAATVPARAAGGVAIRGIVLEDNGDNDGFADTYETVQVHLQVENTSPDTLTGIRASIWTASPTWAASPRP
jgi:hypothetical protein